MKLGLCLFLNLCQSSHLGGVVNTEDPALGGPSVSQACVLSSLVCLLLTPGFYSLPRLSRDLQMSEAKVAFMTDWLQGWNSGEGKSDTAAKFGVSVSPRNLGARQRQAPHRSQLCPVCSAQAALNSPLK